MFYYPDRLLFPNLKLSFEGDIIKSSGETSLTPGNTLNPDPGKGFRPPGAASTQDVPVQAQIPQENTPDLIIPGIKENENALVFKSYGSTYTLSYLLAPTLQLENQFDSTNWLSLENIDYSVQYSHVLTDIPFSIISTATLFGDVLTLENRFTIDNSLTTRFNRSGTVTDATWASYVAADMVQTFVKLGTFDFITLRPFVDIYGLQSSVFHYKINWIYNWYHGSQASPFQWDSFQWTKDTVSMHNFDTTIIYKTDNYPITFTLQSILPPLDQRTDSTLEFYLWLLRTNCVATIKPSPSTGLYQVYVASIMESLDLPPVLSFSEQLRYEYRDFDPTNPLQPTELPTLSTLLRLWKYDANRADYLIEQELAYDLHGGQFTKYRATMLLYAFRTDFLAEKVAPLTGYNGDSLTFASQTQFAPNYLSASFVSKIAEFAFWKQRIFFNISLTSNLMFYFQKFTDSRFTFKLSFNFEVAEFFTLIFSSESYNNNIYKYIPGLPEIVDTEWVNPFVDLIRSFNFASDADRIASGFKIGKLNVSLVHKMYDWDLAFDFSGTFQQDSTLKNWAWMPTFSISIKWQDIPEIKKEMKGDYYNPLNIWT